MGFLSSIISGLFSIGQNERNISAQKRENERDRAFNAEEAEKNRLFQSKEAELAYERQVEFFEQHQSIGAQVKAYKEAGLNPALLADGVSQGSSPSAPAASGSQASSSGSSLPVEVFDLAKLAMGLEDMKSRIKKTEAETGLIEAERANVEKNTSWIDRLNQASLKMSDADIRSTLKDIEVKDNAILVGNAEIEVKASEVALNKIAGALKEMETSRIREMLPFIKALNEAETEDARADAAYKLAAATLAGEQASRTDTGETLDVVNTVVDGIGDTVTTGVLIADMIGEVFGVEDAGQRWQETKRFERDQKGRITSVTREGDGKSKKVSKKRRKRR